MPNKRDFERFQLQGKVEIYLKEECQVSYKGTLINISSIGFCAFLKEKLMVGSEIVFELRISLEDMILKGEGVIRNIVESTENNTHGFRLGINFTKIDKESILMVLNQIESRISEQKRKNKPWFNDSGVSPM